MADESKVLLEEINELERKFDFGMITLTFSTLALSVQFSTKMGKELPWVLLASWIVFLLSGLIGGYRLMYRPVALKWNLYKNRYSSDIQELEAPQFKQAILMKQAVNQHYKTLNENDRIRMVQEKKDFIDTAEKKMEFYSRLSTVFFQIQFYLLVLGLVLNGVFSSANYLHKDRSQSSQPVQSAPD